MRIPRVTNDICGIWVLLESVGTSAPNLVPTIKYLNSTLLFPIGRHA